METPDIENQIEESREEPQKKEDSEKEHFTSFYDWFYVILIFLISIPLIACDFYFSFNRNTQECLTQEMPFGVSLKTYLVVRGFVTIFSTWFLFSSTFFSMIASADDLKETNCCCNSIFILFKIFNLIWSIIGSIMFWKYSDKSLCSNMAYNYIYASLIIMFICLCKKK